jgi:hypothetical protein
MEPESRDGRFRAAALACRLVWIQESRKKGELPESRDGRFRAAALACRLVWILTDRFATDLSILLVCLFVGLAPPTSDCSDNQLSEYRSSVLLCLCACEASLSLCPRAEWPADR